MSTRAAIDLDPAAPPRPTLALVLALLAVPGSTIAWELPLGGLWIGLPLAVAAIYLGLRARSEGSGRGRALAAIVVAGLCIAQMAIWTAVSALASDSHAAAAGRTLTLRELERGATFTHIRNTKTRSREANMQGDVLAFTNPLADATGKRVGKQSVSCTTTTGARRFPDSTMTCVVVLALADGTLTGVANITPGDATITGAITGGTGAYANARGVVSSVRGVDTITLTD